MVGWGGGGSRPAVTNGVTAGGGLHARARGQALAWLEGLVSATRGGALCASPGPPPGLQCEAEAVEAKTTANPSEARLRADRR